MEKWICKNCGIEFNAQYKSYKTNRIYCSKKCESRGSRSKIYGVAVNDLDDTLNKSMQAYIKWRGMLERCYDLKYKQKHPTYNDCYVCNEWLIFSNFKKWFDANNVYGYDLDKDIIVQGNKIYSPDTCCFVPPIINKLLINQKRLHNNYMTGVRKKNNKYESRCQNEKGTSTYLGVFRDEIDAFMAYKAFKEKVICEIANKYYLENKITFIVYKSLLNYCIKPF